MSITLLGVYSWLLPILLWKKKALKQAVLHHFSYKYHPKLHWSCWRAVPAHLRSWKHETCQCLFLYIYICIYTCVLPILLWKKMQIFFQFQISFAAALKLLTSCSRTPWVMTASNMMSIPFLYVYVWQLSILLRKKENFIIFAADTICSCTEAVDELFQRTLGHECMEPHINTITICVYMSIA